MYFMCVAPFRFSHRSLSFHLHLSGAASQGSRSKDAVLYICAEIFFSAAVENNLQRENAATTGLAENRLGPRQALYYQQLTQGRQSARRRKSLTASWRLPPIFPAHVELRAPGPTTQ
jgi:hypothetical protein